VRSCSAQLWLAALLVIPAMASPPALPDTWHNDGRSTPKLLLNPSFSGTSGNLRTVVEDFLRKNAARFGYAADLSTLRLESAEESLLGRHYRYRQYIGDIPVEDAVIVVSIDAGGRIYRVFNDTYPQAVTVKPPAAMLSPEAALDRAWAHLKVHGALHRKPEATLCYAPERGSFRLIYKTSVNVAAPRGSWEHRIDAATGQVLSVRDLRIGDRFTAGESRRTPVPDFSAYSGPVLSRNAAMAALGSAAPSEPAANSTANGAGLVFDPNPRTAIASDSILHTSAAAAFGPAYSSRPLRDITFRAGVYYLTGPWVTIANIETPDTAPSTTTNGTWTTRRGTNAFNDVMVYYHIDQSQRYLQSIGFTNVQHRSIPADSDGESGAANAHFDPTLNALSFGHGAAAPSTEDADVILHEYGHAIQYALNQAWGNGGDTGAMGEGFSDYWAATYHYYSTNGSAFHPSWLGHWFMNTSGSSPTRTLDKLTARYNASSNYTAHASIATDIVSDELWSTPLFQTFLSLIAQGCSRAEVDRILLESYYGVSPSATMREMASVIVNTAQRLYPDGPHAQVFFEKFKTQNILLAFPLAPPQMLYPGADDILLTGATVRVQWERGTAPGHAAAVLEYANRGDTILYSDTMDSGVNGWAASHGTGSVNWAQTTTTNHSAPRCWAATDMITPTDQYLISPAITLTSNAMLSVWHCYDLEWTGDGGVIEISTNGTGGPWMDLGSVMTQNGYPDTVTSPENVLYGRDAFTASSDGFLETLLNLGAFSGRTVRIRFRAATDSGNYYGGTAWWVDDVTVYSAAPWYALGTSSTGASSMAWSVPLTAGTNYTIRGKLTGSNCSDSAWAKSPLFTVSADSDGDGVPDAWELRYFPSLTNSAGTTDSDSDGLTDWAECQAGTLPEVPESTLLMNSAAWSASDDFDVQWQSVTNRLYSLDLATNLASGFSGIASNIPATPPVNTYHDAAATGSSVRLYRVRLQ
jgi:zinc metalloprotease ZmpB